MAALPMPQVPHRSQADGYSFLSIRCPGMSAVAPPAHAPAFASRKVCAALGMRVIPTRSIPSSVLLPGEPEEGCRIRHFCAKPFLWC